jgi:hypothetical protein
LIPPPLLLLAPAAAAPGHQRNLLLQLQSQYLRIAAPQFPRYPWHCQASALLPAHPLV